MINYNNNKQQYRFQESANKQTDNKAQLKSKKNQAIAFEQLSVQKYEQEEKISKWQTPKVLKNVGEWQDLNQIDYKKQKAQMGQKQMLKKEMLKQVIHYQKNKKVDGQTSQNRLMSKLNFIINAAVDGNEDITVSNCSANSIKQSNNSSDTSSIHSNDRNWRNQFYKQVENNQFENKKRVHNEKTEKIQKKIFFHDEEIGKNGFKYLFYQQSSQKQQAEHKTLQINKRKQNQKVKQEIKLVKNQPKKVKEQNLIVSGQSKVKYTYQKGKHKQGETQQQRVKNKLVFLLNPLQENSQLISASYNLQKEIIQAIQLKAIVRKKELKDVQQYKVQEIQNQVIFVQNKEQKQPTQSMVKQKKQKQNHVVQKSIFEELQNRKQIQEEKSQIAAITPKQTIQLDKSFKSKNSKLTPKSKILSQSLDKSNKGKGRVISHKIPVTVKQRKNSMEQLNQIIADIQKKSQQYKSAVGNSFRSKNKSQAEDQSEVAENNKKYSVKSARKIFDEDKNQSSSEDKRVEQSKLHRNTKDNQQAKISKQSFSSQFEAKIQKIQLKKTSFQQLSDNLKSEYEKISEQKQMNVVSKLSQKNQSSSIISKQESKQGSSASDLKDTKQHILSTNLKKNSVQLFNQQNEAIKDRPKVKQTKQIKQTKMGYLKTLLKEDIDESELITQFLPKNKIQFKIDVNRRLKTQVGSIALQNKKFQALLKRRQNVLIKKSKQQIKIDPKSFVFPESSSGVSKQSSMKSNQHNFSDSKLHMLTARNFIGESKTKILTSIGFKRDSLNGQKKYLPVLSARTQQVREQQKIVKMDSNSLKKQIYDTLNQNKSKVDSLFQKRTAYQEQTQKALQRKPTVKIQFHSLSKTKVNQNSSQKYMQAKQKYQRLKQLLASQ